jgi:hypothetical protein
MFPCPSPRLGYPVSKDALASYRFLGAFICLKPFRRSAAGYRSSAVVPQDSQFQRSMGRGEHGWIASGVPELTVEEAPHDPRSLLSHCSPRTTPQIHSSSQPPRNTASSVSIPLTLRLASGFPSACSRPAFRVLRHDHQRSFENDRLEEKRWAVAQVLQVADLSATSGVQRSAGA